jgi:hypothetical protein
MLITYIKGGTPAQIFLERGFESCRADLVLSIEEMCIFQDGKFGSNWSSSSSFRGEDLWKSLRGTTDDDGHQVMAIAHMAPLDQVS